MFEKLNQEAQALEIVTEIRRKGHSKQRGSMLRGGRTDKREVLEMT